VPAGSGPQIARTTGTSVAASEVALVTLPAQSWLEQLGTLLSASVNFTPGTGQTTLTLRFRQGNGTGGALVGIAHNQTTIAAAPLETAIQEQDTSAFALAGVNQQYTLTVQANAAGPGTSNAALAELETIAPLL
jgi:hypothetical protein